MTNIVLYYNDLALGGTSDKTYRVQIVKKGDGFCVNFQFGRRDGTLQDGTKTAFPVPAEEAAEIFQKLVSEKMKNGYVPSGANAPVPVQLVKSGRSERTPFPIEDLEEVATMQESDAFLHSPKFWLQVKVDGQFCQVQKRKDGTYARFNKLGNAVPSLPSEVTNELNKLKASTFFLEGELIGNWFVVFNLLEIDGADLTKRTYSERFDALEGLILASGRFVTIVATWKTKAEKLEGMKALVKNRAEGAVYKLISAPYKGGSRKQHFKFKFVKTLSAVVIDKGFKGHNSATLGLLGSDWHSGGTEYIEVGRCSLNGKEQVAIGQVVEVKYLYGTAGNRLYQPRMIRVRTDVDPKQCTIKQIIYKEGVDAA